MFGAPLQSLHIKDRLPERLAAKAAAQGQRLAESEPSVPEQQTANEDIRWRRPLQQHKPAARTAG